MIGEHVDLESTADLGLLMFDHAEAELCVECGCMADWPEPAYSRNAVTAAGRTYIDPTASLADRELALVVINNWRSSHRFPLNTHQVNLRRLSGESDADFLVAQRIKRLPSIVHKLERFQGMDLARVQDIGGCRAVLSSVDAVRDVAKAYKSRRTRSELAREDWYIDQPQKTGYRGVHLVYKYRGDRTRAWDNLKVEVQVRSRLQHAWATAVETVSTFTRQALKSNQGEDEWLRFFALMGSALAMREGTTPVPGTPTDPRELGRELRRYSQQLQVQSRLNAFGATLQQAAEEFNTKGRAFILELKVQETDAALRIRSYNNARIATDEYNALERVAETEQGMDVVLVSVASLASLRRAYPNYFLDTAFFLEAVNEAIQ